MQIEIFFDVCRNHVVLARFALTCLRAGPKMAGNEGASFR